MRGAHSTHGYHSGKFRVLYRSSPMRRCFRIDSAGFAGRYSSSTACQSVLSVRTMPRTSRLQSFCAGSDGPWAWRWVEPAVDVEALHAKIGQLTLENDFGCALLGRAIHCVVEATASSARARGGRIASGPVRSTGRLFIRAVVFECG